MQKGRIASLWNQVSNSGTQSWSTRRKGGSSTSTTSSTLRTKKTKAKKKKSSSSTTPSKSSTKSTTSTSTASTSSTSTAPPQAPQSPSYFDQLKQIYMQGGDELDENGEYTTLLPPQLKKHEGKLCVVLDMDETLLHSEFETVDNDFRQTEDRELAQGDADFVLNLGADDQEEMVFVHKRPGVDAFLDTLAKHFEVIVFTAALPVYAAPVLDKVDPVSRVTHRLYRDATVTYKGQSFVKDLANFGRDAGRIVLIDNNPYAMLATPDNAMPIRSYYDDPRDRELEKITAMLMEMKDMKDVRPYLKKKFEFAKQLKAMMQMEEM